MKVNFIITLIITLMVLSCDNMNEADFQEAKELQKLKKYEDSNEILTRLVEKKYKLDTVYFLLGQNYFSIKNDEYNFDGSAVDYSLSIEYYSKVIDENPNYFSAYINRIRSNHNQGRHKINLKQIKEAIEMFRDSTELILYRGTTKAKLGDYEGSDIDINSFLGYEDIDTSDIISAYRWLGLNHKEKLEFKEAVKDFTKAIQLDTVNTDSYLFVNRGEAYQGLRDKKNACKDFRKAADLGVLFVLKDLRNYCN